MTSGNKFAPFPTAGDIRRAVAIVATASEIPKETLFLIRNILG